jgi:GDSL-like Lipase/Acylhydrolase family
MNTQISASAKPIKLTRPKRAVFATLMVVLLLAPVVLAEILLRSSGLGHPILFYTNASYRIAPQPNQKQLRLRGASVTLDSKGLRGVKDWTRSADVKILFVGDSVTWAGTYIDDHDTFAEGVCARLARGTAKTFTCGNAGVNAYGTDNMAERIRYKDFADETVLVVTLVSHDARLGLTDEPGRFFFTQDPPGPFKALWEATTFVVWRLYDVLRPPHQAYRGDDDDRVAERSLQNLFSAIRETDRPGRKVLIVLSPLKVELNGRESEYTKRVRAVLERSGFEFLDLHPAVSAASTSDFFYDDVHLEVPGHRFYADQITRRLQAYFTRSGG